MTTMEEVYEEWERQKKAEGLEQGLKRSLITVYQARFGAPPPEITAAIEATHDTTVLNRCLEQIGTGTPEDIAATLRAEGTSSS